MPQGLHLFGGHAGGEADVAELVLFILGLQPQLVEAVEGAGRLSEIEQAPLQSLHAAFHVADAAHGLAHG